MDAQQYDDGHDIYEQLARATPETRTEIVLRLIEDHPERRLVLPSDENGVKAELSGIDLGSDSLKRRLQDLGRDSAPWWDPHKGGARLLMADLSGASIHMAKLNGANCELANFDDVSVWQSQLRNTDLSGASFQNASVTDSDLSGSNLMNAKLQRCNLSHSDLREADFAGANLRGSTLMDADYDGARFFLSDLRDANLWGASFQRSDFGDAQLQRINLTGSNINNAAFRDAFLDKTPIRQQQVRLEVGEKRWADEASDQPELRAKWLGNAAEAYRALKQNFEDLGDYGAANWAYCKERRMGKLESRVLARSAVASWQPVTASLHFWSYLTDQFVELVSD